MDSRSPPTTAHPHSRGENLSGSYPATWQLGSSPLTRGKRALDLPVEISDGLIPTHAGKTANRAPRYCTVTAHPHSRGENAIFGVSSA